MKLLLRTFGNTNGFGDADTQDCDCVVVDITYELFTTIQKRVAMMRDARGTDRDLQTMEFIGAYEFAAYDNDLIRQLDDHADDYAAEFWDDGKTNVPDWMTVDDSHEQRIECRRMVLNAGPSVHDDDISDYEVNWTFLPKHTDVDLWTATLSLGEIVDMLAADGVIA